METLGFFIESRGPQTFLSAVFFFSTCQTETETVQSEVPKWPDLNMVCLGIILVYDFNRLLKVKCRS